MTEVIATSDDVINLRIENAELRRSCQKWFEHCRENKQSELSALSKVAELKEAIKHFNPCCEWGDDAHDCEFRHYAMEYGSKLTEAKDIIKELLDVLFINDCAISSKIKCKTENFLKEE